MIEERNFCKERVTVGAVEKKRTTKGKGRRRRRMIK